MTRLERPKRQPELVRRRLLDSAAMLAVKNGINGVSLSTVAADAGVTKGGLFHHFPNKQALTAALFDDVLQRLDEEIDRYIALDNGGHGCFTRAYIRVGFASSPDRHVWAALTYSMQADKELYQGWELWLSDRLKRHRATDGSEWLRVVRLAADGAWFTALMKGWKYDEEISELEKQLILFTSGSANEGF